MQINSNFVMMVGLANDERCFDSQSACGETLRGFRNNNENVFK